MKNTEQEHGHQLVYIKATGPSVDKKSLKEVIAHFYGDHDTRDLKDGAQ
jgi:hypothetical protein